jgi:hypothetical protein
MTSGNSASHLKLAPRKAVALATKKCSLCPAQRRELRASDGLQLTPVIDASSESNKGRQAEEVRPTGF